MKKLSVLLLVFVWACNGGGNEDLYSIIDSDGASSYMDEMEVEETSLIRYEVNPTALQKPQQIIKSGRLVFESAKPEETHQKILDLAKKANGLVQNDVSGKSYNRIYRNMTVRVPSQQFQSFIDGISEGVEYFDTRDISRKDVTEEFVDLEARLKAKRELENRYIALLKEAKNVKEMLEIERELSQIREEIEAKQGRLNYLKDRVSMSTVTIEFYKLTTQTGVTVSYGQKMANALKGGWDGISMFFLGILYLWPLFLVLIIGILVVRKWLRKRKHK